MCRVGEYAVECGLHNLLDFLGAQAPGIRTFGSILGQARGSLLLETSPPQHNGDTGCLQPSSNSTVGRAVSGQQADPRSKNDPLRGSLGTHPSLQLDSILNTHGQRYIFVSHAAAVPQLALCVQLFMRQHTRRRVGSRSRVHGRSRFS